MDEEYYKEDRGTLLRSSWHLLILTVGFSFVVGMMSMIIYRMASAGVELAPYGADLPNPAVIPWAAGIIIPAFWIMFFSAVCYERHRYNKLDAIPLTHERITVESRNVVGREYTMISDSGVVYNVLNEETFSQLTPGARVSVVSKHYPKNENKKPLLIRAM